MIYYILTGIAAIMFAFQFLFNKKYQQLEGTSLEAAIIFSCGVQIVKCIIMLAINKFDIEINPFSLFVALLYSTVSIAFTYYSVKAFKTANLSLYSLLAMIGGMLLPFIAGVIIWSEPLTTKKIISCFLIFVSLLLGAEKSAGKKGPLYYYINVFILNGPLWAYFRNGTNQITETIFPV